MLLFNLTETTQDVISKLVEDEQIFNIIHRELLELDINTTKYGIRTLTNLIKNGDNEVVDMILHSNLIFDLLQFFNSMRHIETATLALKCIHEFLNRDSKRTNEYKLYFQDIDGLNILTGAYDYFNSNNEYFAICQKFQDTHFPNGK